MRGTAVLAFCVAVACGSTSAAAANLAAQCRAAGNDDTIRPYDPAVRTKLLEAYRRQFPKARAPSQKRLAAQTNIRCMDGHLLACFTGANRPCRKLNMSRENRGADAWCHDNPDAAVVPAFAAGHDSAYSYHCAAGRAEVIGPAFSDIDQRGFARHLWTPID